MSLQVIPAQVHGVLDYLTGGAFGGNRTVVLLVGHPLPRIC